MVPSLSVEFQRPLSSLPSSVSPSYCGSPEARISLYCEVFRRTVLEPHGIEFRSSDTCEIPGCLWDLIDDSITRVDRFVTQSAGYLEQLRNGNGFGSSPVFPACSLPPLHHWKTLTRCIEPELDQKLLPGTSPFDLLTIKPAISCGFTEEAFDELDLPTLPSWLGKSFNSQTCRMTESAPVYQPYLLYERIYGEDDCSLQLAVNQCAISASCVLRTWQLLYAKAEEGSLEYRAPRPVCFSCCINNDVAVINFHWIDQTKFCIASLCKFYLRRGDMELYLAWTDGINKWAASQLLAQCRAAVDQLSLSLDAPVLEYGCHRRSFVSDDRTGSQKVSSSNMLTARVCSPQERDGTDPGANVSRPSPLAPHRSGQSAQRTTFTIQPESERGRQNSTQQWIQYVLTDRTKIDHTYEVRPD